MLSLVYVEAHNKMHPHGSTDVVYKYHLGRRLTSKVLFAKITLLTFFFHEIKAQYRQIEKGSEIWLMSRMIVRTNASACNFGYENNTRLKAA